MIRRFLDDHRGFTLPEILIAAAVMLIIMGGVMSLYLGSQRTAKVETDFADVQDNLRLALDQLTKDVRMAGFLVAGAPITDISQTAFTLRTTSPFRRYARIIDPGPDPDPDPDTVTTTKTFTVYSASMAECFRPGDKVRIIRPPNQEQPGSGVAGAALVFDVSAVDPTVPSISLSGFSAGTDYAYAAGDMVVRVADGAPVVSEIRYQFNPSPANSLERIVNGGTPQILARNLTDVAFAYVLNDEGEVRTVNVVITGATSPEPDPDNRIPRRTRTLRSSIAVRNI
ncbi:PilW family protein [Geoalkalibacter sp.]|uniref:PilW family protein n=1 Tax=Geoalkalibacter sp. TaxID=3041440 RepID=UPI00272E6D29|nr:prepilin-type N-terminal cleavage/methylation domain-containing protein [Geoalkalibacter sp.]